MLENNLLDLAVYLNNVGNGFGTQSRIHGEQELCKGRIVFLLDEFLNPEVMGGGVLEELVSARFVGIQIKVNIGGKGLNAVDSQFLQNGVGLKCGSDGLQKGSRNTVIVLPGVFANGNADRFQRDMVC